jgi:hypothetical protein
MALARLQANSRPELNAMMNSLELGGDGRTVSLAFSVPSEVIDMLGAMGAPHRPADPDPDPDVDAPAPPEPPQPPAPPQPPRPSRW